MPLFDFECKNGHVFDAFQKADFAGPKRVAVCPDCGAPAEWLPSRPAAFVFTFKPGFDSCTGRYHPTKKHYEDTKRELGLVKLE